MKLAICQPHIIWEQKLANLQKCEVMVSEAKKAQADLVLFPEMSFTGFSMNLKVVAEAQLETVNRVKTMARKQQLHIGFGWVKKVGEKAENHYSICDSSGHLVLDYVKIHPFSFSGENQYFIPGNQVSSCVIAGVTLSVFICYDLRFPELFQNVPEEVSLVLVPAEWPKARRQHWNTLLAARAIENQCYLAGINGVGTIGGLNYSGDSCLVSPDGQVLNQLSNQEGLLLFELNESVADLRETFPVRQDRRVAFYRELYQKKEVVL